MQIGGLTQKGYACCTLQKGEVTANLISAKPFCLVVFNMTLAALAGLFFLHAGTPVEVSQATLSAMLVVLAIW